MGIDLFVIITLFIIAIEFVLLVVAHAEKPAEFDCANKLTSAVSFESKAKDDNAVQTDPKITDAKTTCDKANVQVTGVYNQDNKTLTSVQSKLTPIQNLVAGGFVLVGFLYLLIPSLIFNGSTVGKRWKHLVVVRQDGSPAAPRRPHQALRTARGVVSGLLLPRSARRCDCDRGRHAVDAEPEPAGLPRPVRTHARREKGQLMPKYVFAFEEGSQGPEVPAGRQGRQPRRDDESGLPVPPGFTITTEASNHHGRGRLVPGRAVDEVAAVKDRVGCLEDLRRHANSATCDRPLLVSVLFRRAVIDARHDGHHPEPRTQRRIRQRLGPPDEQRAVRVRLVPPFRADVRQDRARRFR